MSMAFQLLKFKRVRRDLNDDIESGLLNLVDAFARGTNLVQ